MKRISSIKFLSVIMIMATTIVAISFNSLFAAQEMRTISSFEIVKEMKVGWNLGNTLDAEGGETEWGNPVTTKAMIDEVKAKGFNTVRLPITYDGHIGEGPDYIIDSEWMNRVNEVVDYVIDNNMYAIINTHHEGGWLIPDYAHEDEITDRLVKMWEQIAARFMDYGDHLVFETMNEPRVIGSDSEWVGGTYEYRDVINALNLAAVNAIRASGGNNAERYIMIPTHAASTVQAAMDDLVIPNNDDRIIVSLHMYSPYYFSMVYEQTAQWGTDSDKAELDSAFDAIYNTFVRNGRAVVLGEWGTINKDENVDARVTHAGYYVKAAKERGITTIWWDNGIVTAGAESYGLFNRNDLTWYYPQIADAIIENAVTAAEDDDDDVDDGSSTTTDCSVEYNIQNDWNTGAVVSVTINNGSSSQMDGWTLQWTFNGDEKISNLWNGTYTQNGKEVEVKNTAWNASLAANGSIAFGMGLTYSGSTTVPGSFTLNGTACSVK